VLIDRLSHEVPFYRFHLKAAALAGTYVINDPHWWSADEKFFGFSQSEVIGKSVMGTIVPYTDTSGRDLARATQTSIDELTATRIHVAGTWAATNAEDGVVLVWTTGFAIFFGLLISVLVAVWIGTFMVFRRLTANVDQMETLARGDLTARSTKKNLARVDEMGNLSRAADRLALSLHESLLAISTSAHHLDGTSQVLGQRMDQSIAVVEGMNREIAGVNDQVVGQSASINTTSATSLQILANLEGLGDLISEQAANVTQSSASIEQMIRNIEAVTGMVFSRPPIFSISRVPVACTTEPAVMNRELLKRA